MQGDIESVAALSAKDLTALIEQVSGSAAFKKEYDRCENMRYLCKLSSNSFSRHACHYAYFSISCIVSVQRT